MRRRPCGGGRAAAARPPPAAAACRRRRPPPPEAAAVRRPPPPAAVAASSCGGGRLLLRRRPRGCRLDTHTMQTGDTHTIPYYHFATYYTHTSHAHKPHPLITPPSTAVSRHACGRPRRGAVAAVLPHWSHDDGRLPGGRLTLQLPPPANGHGRGALCERRNGTASAQWAPRLPGQPASRLHLQALVRAAFDHFDPDRRGLWVRHADTHAQANSYRPRGHPGHMSAHAAAAAAQSVRGGAEVSVAPRRSFGLKSR